MTNKTTQFKHELERRFLKCSSNTLTGFLVYVQNYIEFIQKSYFLKRVINEIALSESQMNLMYKEGYRPSFAMIYIMFVNKVLEFSEENPPSIWTKRSHEQKLKGMFRFIHDQIIAKLSEYEILNPKDRTAKEPDKDLEILGLNKDTAWEDIQINFINEFEVRINHRENNYITTHEKLGFADKRQKDKTVADGGWELLQVLSIQNGVFELGNISNQELERRKKQKQRLSAGLKNYFGITGDPFLRVNKEKRQYKIKIKLLPDPEFRPKKRDFDISDQDKRYIKQLSFLKQIDDL
ncbi:MAG: hypothetical protein KBC69_00505 [Candidatus Magasanikbacteria bacterium]|nr:hypothetical protein [Candidatus Magasanikbacteria bacterium]